MQSAYKPLPHQKKSRNEIRATWSSLYLEHGNDIFETSNNSKIYKDVHRYICVLWTYKIINSLYLFTCDVHKKTNILRKIGFCHRFVLFCILQLVSYLMKPYRFVEHTYSVSWFFRFVETYNVVFVFYIKQKSPCSAGAHPPLCLLLNDPTRLYNKWSPN
jgi:hypothetical protein